MRRLTTREKEIANLVRYGMSNKQIANILGISDGTVKIHLHNIYRKMSLGGRIHLAVVVFASERFLLAQGE
jgi:two-component system nitrate/nitrite response regulator NarL